MATSYGSPRIFMDPVHGSIELEGYLVRIIDTPEFQRLRKIKQLGGVCYVFPGATHTRFEHSIGVCHIASEFIKQLNLNSGKRLDGTPWINEEEKVCIKIAALCHDLGHGPYSHVYDFAAKTLKLEDKRASHEYRSAAIIEKVLSKSEVKESIRNHLNGSWELAYTYEKYIKLIKRMITFSEDFKETKNPTTLKKAVTVTDKNGKEEEKSYLFEIVANAFTGIDVDKMDYFARDSRSVGLSNNFDWRRYSLTAKILLCHDKFTHICSRDKDAAGLYELFHIRNVLHRTVYKHKTALLIEYMLKKAMIEASKAIKLTHHSELDLLQCWKDASDESKVHEAFIKLTDEAIEQLIKGNFSEDWTIDRDDVESQNNLEKAKEWLHKIETRQLYKFLGSCKKGKEELEFLAKATKLNVDVKNDLISEEAKFSYGKGTDNPMELHYFFNKWEPKEPFCFSKEEVSVFLPENFKETIVYWYLGRYDEMDTTVTELRKSLKKGHPISTVPMEQRRRSASV